MESIVSVILAAGAGTRMKSDKPKVAHELCGKSMLGWVVKATRESGSSHTIVVVGHQFEQVKSILDDQKVDFVIQKKQLGTGHAVMQAKEYLKDIKGTVLILCGDTPLITSETLQNAYNMHKQGEFSATVITARFDNPDGYGRIVRGEDGKVIKIVEHKDATDEQRLIQEINAGMYCFNVEDLVLALDKLDNNNSQGEYYLTDTVEILISQGKSVGGYQVLESSEIMGINNRIQLAEAMKHMRRKIIEKNMIKGVTIIDPENVYIDDEVEIDMDTVLYPGTVLEGSTSVGNNCIIGPNTRIVNSKIDNKVEVNTSVILDSIVGEGTKVGPFAYLRPGSTIGRDVKIGDFVEVKKSIIGDKTKISHLTYVGDAEIGNNVNLGCGVVVVNYNGKKKHKTTVGDNSFVGCNVNLISPVNLDPDTYIAAGSTITNNVPRYSLAIARNKQTIIKDWVKRKGLDKK